MPHTLGAKFELLPGAITVPGEPPLFRIRALRSFGRVRAGEHGGLVRNEKNLSHVGHCWIGPNAKAVDESRVSGDAQLRDYATACGSASVKGRAVLCDHFIVSEHALACGDFTGAGHARLAQYATGEGSATLQDWAIAAGNSVLRHNALVGGHSYVADSTVLGSGVAMPTGVERSHSGRSGIWGGAGQHTVVSIRAAGAHHY